MNGLTFLRGRGAHLISVLIIGLLSVRYISEMPNRCNQSFLINHAGGMQGSHLTCNICCHNQPLIYHCVLSCMTGKSLLNQLGIYALMVVISRRSDLISW